ncbi:MAG: site-2 protease family protein [Acidobacteria bacterium]|nr:site-2 protease family protein [Acidobacteriota bacterium]
MRPLVGRLAFPMLNLFGIRVRVHFTFILLLVWMAVLAPNLESNAVLLGLVVVGLLASVVLHELGHALTARRYGIETREIVLTPIGGVARLDGYPQGLAELAIAAAGPLVNLALAMVLFFGLLVAGLPPWGAGAVVDLHSALQWLLFGNLCLFALNLLPAFPLDGGRILRSALSFLLGQERATKIATRLGLALAAVLGLAALVPWVLGLMFNMLLLLTAFFVLLGATRESSLVKTLQALEGRRAGEAMMTRCERLAPQDTIEWAVRLLLSTTQRQFPVVDGWGRVAGEVDRDRLLELVARCPGDTPLLELMNREPLTVTEDCDLLEVLRQLQSSARALWVVRDHELRGMLTADGLSQFVEVCNRLRHRDTGAVGS